MVERSRELSWKSSINSEILLFGVHLHDLINSPDVQIFIPSQWRNRFNAFVWGCGVKRHRFPLMWKPFCYSIFPTLVLLCSCQYFSRADLASLLSQCVILVILVIFRISRVAYFVRLLVSHVLDSGLRPSCLLTSSAFPHFTKSLWSFILLSHESQPRCPLSLSP